MRQSLDSSTAARFRFPRYSSSLASNLAKSVSASAAEPANPASTCPPCMVRILTASPFITVCPKRDLAVSGQGALAPMADGEDRGSVEGGSVGHGVRPAGSARMVSILRPHG